MTCSILVDGDDYAGRIQIDDGLLGLVTMADMGAVGGGAFKVEDPEGELDLMGWRSIVVEESECSQPRIFTGRMGGKGISRGRDSNRAGAARLWDCTILDLNSDLQFGVLLPNAASKRPYESEPDRMDWLLSSRAMTIPGVTDEGLIDTSGGQSFDESDFGGQYAGQVLDSMASTSKNFYVYRNHANNHHGLFWDQPDAPVRDCTLKISNVASDVDFVTTFETFRDAVLTRDPDEVWSGELLIYQGNQWVYHTRDSTADNFIWRDHVDNTSRIGRLATADAQAETILDMHDHEFDTITCSVKVPPSAVGLIEAGMRIQVKFSHLPSYESFTWMRITQATVFFLPGTNEFYVIQLELSMKKLAGLIGGGSSGGGGGVHIPQPPSTPTIVNGVCNASTSASGGQPAYIAAGFASGDEPDAGDVVVFQAVVREGTSVTLAAGWTLIGRPVIGLSGGELAFEVIMAAIVADPTTPSAAQPSAGLFYLSTTNSGYSHRSTVQALKGVSIAGLVSTIYPASNTSSRAMAVAASSAGIVVSSYGDDWSNTITDGAGFTTTCNGQSDSSIPPSGSHAYQVVSGAGTITNTVAIGSGGTAGAGVIAFFPAANDVDTTNPPTPNQTVPWAPAASVTIGSTTTTITTLWPYAPGSLEVRVDNIPVSASHLDMSDPATGEAIIDWKIDSDETVTVQYIGA